MSWFDYEGLTPGGTLVNGRLEAASHDQAHTELAGMNIEVRRLEAAPAPPSRGVVLNEDELIFFNDQLGSMASAGIALDEGLQQLARDVQSSRFRHWLEGLAADLRSGMPLERAIAARESGLPVLYSQVVKAGLKTGRLPLVLLNLNQHLRLVGATRRIIWETAAYPLFVVLLAMGVTGFVVGTVMPQFREIFKDFGTQLPLLTEFMLDVSEQAPAVLIGLIGAVLLLILFWSVLKHVPSLRPTREWLLLGMPGIGRLARASLAARFLRSASTALASGLPLPDAIRLSAGATGSPGVIADAEYLAGEVEQGRSIWAASPTTRVIPALFGYCVQVAAGRDALPAALSSLAMSYENRALHAQTMVRVILLPLLVIILGLLLGTVVLSLFLPLVSLINSVSG